MASSHLFEQVADDLSQWIAETSSSLATQLAGGSHAPFAANATEAEKLDYYRSKMFNPDGSPNVQERQNLLDRAGVQGYAHVLSALGKQRPDLADHPLQAQIADNTLGNGEGNGASSS
jgi:hypothetical protein